MESQDRLTTLIKATSDPNLTVRWNYYWGNHPKVYATPKLAEVFRTLADSFVENYCGLAVNTRLSRLEITGWQGPGADAAQQVWDASRLPQYQDRLYRWGLVHSRAYVVTDQDDTGSALRIHPATLVYAEPDPDDAHVVEWAGKSWFDKSEGVWRATLWYPDRTERWVSSGKKKDAVNDYRLAEESGNSTGVVPVFEVSPYGDGPPLIDQIAPIQDRINKIGANKFVAAEFGAFKQRVFFTRQDLQPYDVRQAPDHAIVLDPGDPDGRASVQELGATDLSNYDSAKDSEIDSLFTVATLPRHLRVNPGATPSGEAIKADEGPFVESVVEHQRSMSEALILAMESLGVEAEPVWRDPVVANDATTAQVVGSMVDAGVPLAEALMRYAGWSEEDAAALAPNVAGNAVGAALLQAFNAPGVPQAEPATGTPPETPQ